LLVCVNSLVGAEEPDAPTPDEERLELMNRVFSEFELRFAENAERSLPRTKQPILRWSNPVRNSFSDGTTYLWLNDARPVAVATISIRGNGAVWREFTTLAAQPLKVTQDGQVVWSPAAGDLVFKPLKGAPSPASSERLRLSQMRKLAEQFRITMFETGSNREEFKNLRLLPQPVYQWSSKVPAVSHGAMFAFCETTDPEAALLLEVYAEKVDDPPVWRYSLARQTSRPLSFFHNDEKVGSVKAYWKNPRTRQDPYAEKRLSAFEQNK
jgi:hypothetical protein